MLLISKETKRVLVPYDSRIQALFPEALTIKHNGHNLAVLPHNPRTHIQLRAAEIETPAPILSHYDWCGAKPFATQKTTATLLTSHQRAYVLSDMGTGKTRAALWAWDYLNKTGCARKLLVVAPLSTLKFTWLSEIHKTMPSRKAVVLHATNRERRHELLAQDADIYIINHDGLKVVLQELWNRKDIDTLCLDELAVYRNHGSKRSRTMREFAKRFTWVWGMTGRPMPQAPTDVWAQARILTPGNVPKYFRHAQSMLMHPVDFGHVGFQRIPFKWVPKPNAIEKAFSWMQPSVRFSLDDVVELPEAISRTIDVEFTEQQLRVYRRLANELAVMVENKVITAANAGIALGKLLQIGAGHVYTDNPLYVTLDSAPRQQALLDIIEEAEHKLIVFAPWRHLVENLSTLLTTNGIDHAVVHGDTPKREEIFHDFQNSSRYRVLLAHPACVHHGLTLTAATTIVWYSPIPSLEIYEQANARIRRVGQRHKQQFIHFCGSKVERKIYAMLNHRQKLQDEFLHLIKAATLVNSDEQEYAIAAQ